MGYDPGDSFPFDFELNVIPLGSKSKEKLSPRSYPPRLERKWKYSFLTVCTYTATAPNTIIACCIYILCITYTVF